MEIQYSRKNHALTRASSKRLVAATLITLGSVLAAAPASAAIVTNGSFESTVVNENGTQFTSNNLADLKGGTGPSWNVFTNIEGWTTSNGSGIEIQSATTVPQIDAQDEDLYVELDSHNTGSNSTMTQTVSLDAGMYQLSFWYSPRIDNVSQNTNRIDYSLGGLFSESVSGPSSGPPETSFGTWTEITQEFTVGTDGNFALAFGAFGQEDTLGGFIDNVSITAVPLPAAAWLFLSALGGLGIIKRKHS